MHPGMHEYLLTGCAATGARFVTTRQKNNPSACGGTEEATDKKKLEYSQLLQQKQKFQVKNSAVTG